MSDLIAQIMAELRSVGNIIHGPEIWLAFPFVMFAGLISALIGYFVFSHWDE